MKDFVLNETNKKIFCMLDQVNKRLFIKNVWQRNKRIKTEVAWEIVYERYFLNEIKRIKQKLYV